MQNGEGDSIMTKNMQPQVFLLRLERFSLILQSSRLSHCCWIVLILIGLMINDVINKLKSDHLVTLHI